MHSFEYGGKKRKGIWIWDGEINDKVAHTRGMIHTLAKQSN
jgi:hypothetical protein